MKTRIFSLIWRGTFSQAWGQFPMKGFVPHAQSAPFMRRLSCIPSCHWFFFGLSFLSSLFRVEFLCGAHDTDQLIIKNKQMEQREDFNLWLSHYYARKHEFPCATTCLGRIAVWQHPLAKSRSSVDSCHSSLRRCSGLFPRCSDVQLSTAALRSLSWL